MGEEGLGQGPGPRASHTPKAGLPDARKQRWQEEKGTTEDEIVGWHHRLNGHEFEYPLGGPGIEPRSPALQESSLPSEPPGNEIREENKV